MSKRNVTVVGAGIVGLWCALTLARRGFDVCLLEASPEPFADAASRWAGAMLAPYCEEEGAEPLVRELGLQGMPIWRAEFPDIAWNGTLVLAAARDQGELRRFQRMTRGHAGLDADGVSQLEPDLSGRYHAGLFYSDEAHMPPRETMGLLLARARESGADVRFGDRWNGRVDGWTIDCRGLGARNDLSSLRGVRGERILVRTNEVKFSRPVRLLHPRHPLYVVPWGNGIFMVGATVIESEDTSPMSVRSALELLGLAYALHPAFGEAEIVELGAGLRPSFPDNSPKVVIRNQHLLVNGLYRHGFLLGPVLAAIVADYIESGARRPGVLVNG